MLSIRLHWLAALSLPLVGSACLGSRSNTLSVAETCSALSQKFPHFTLFPNQTLFKTVNEDYFSAENWLGPACIFTTTSTDALSSAVTTVRDANVPFAVRGGGWMPVKGSANIDSSGILLSTSNLTGLSLSQDRSVVSVGSGESWAAIYDYLEPYGLSVVGSRIGFVGVPGFLLGGGMSFFSNQYGWASANLAGYELILSSGSIVYATADNEYADLYWALRGGGNNFGIVTRLDIRTIEAPQVTAGKISYGPNLRYSFVKSLYNFSQEGVLDPHAFVLPTMSYIPVASPNITYSGDLFYNGNDTSPKALEEFLPPLLAPESNTFSTRTMADWSVESDEGFEQVKGQNFRFHGFSMLSDLDAMFVTHDIFFRYVQERGQNITGFISTLAMNPISKNYIVAGRGEDASGDPMGIDAHGGPYFYCEETISWTLDSDTDRIGQLIDDLNAELKEKLGDKLVPFLYLNNAGDKQDVFHSYNATNLERMVAVRDKYDPTGLYAEQLVGGFKLPAPL